MKKLERNNLIITEIFILTNRLFKKDTITLYTF